MRSQYLQQLIYPFFFVLAEEGRLDVVEFLASQGASFGARDEMENTSLMGAIYTRQLHIIAYLLEKQVVSLDDKNLWGYTPLIVASIENYAEIVEALLNRGVNIEDVDREDMTALLWAAMKGNIETLQMLISRGANVHAKDMFSNTALLLAASEGQVNTVRYLLSKGYASITESNDDDVTALLCACRVTLPSTSLLWHLEVVKQQ